MYLTDVSEFIDLFLTTRYDWPHYKDMQKAIFCSYQAAMTVSRSLTREAVYFYLAQDNFCVFYISNILISALSRIVCETWNVIVSNHLLS